MGVTVGHELATEHIPTLHHTNLAFQRSVHSPAWDQFQECDALDLAAVGGDPLTTEGAGASTPSSQPRGGHLWSPWSVSGMGLPGGQFQLHACHKHFPYSEGKCSVGIFFPLETIYRGSNTFNLNGISLLTRGGK